MVQIVLVTFSVAFLLVLFFEQAGLKLGFVDAPGPRKMQSVNIPRCGGCAFAIAILVSVCFFGVKITWAEWIGATVIFAGGVYDDLKRKNTVLVKTLFQLLAIGVFCIWVELPGGISFPHSLLLRGGILFFIWGMVNAFNLMDNINGLASGLSMILLTGFGFLIWNSGGDFYLPMIASAAVFAFFIRNYYAGKIFMGDQGSQLLGFITGVVAVKFLINRYLQWEEPRLLKYLLLLAIFFFPFVVDTAVVVVIRWLKGKPWYIGDQNHISHQLVKLGYSPSRAVAALFGFQILFFFLGYWWLTIF